MKRTLAFWGAVSILFVTSWTTDVVAQEPQPADASGDTLKTEEPAPAETQQQAPGMQAQPAPADTMTAAARIKKAQGGETVYALSLGLGTALPQEPAAFSEEYDASFDFLLNFGARRWDFEASLSFDYNFFFTTLQRPDDLSIMMIFVNLKYLFLETTARPYLVVCGGWFRSWIVDDLDPNNTPETVEFALDDDSDGSVNEDPVDEIDNDGDGSIDEDPPGGGYSENVLGYGAGGGVEIEIDKVRRIFFDVRYIEGQTRDTQNHANMVIIPVRIGLTWVF